MAGFNEREKGFESKYKHDQETQFKITARRNKLLGLWAAEKLGITGPAADAYAREVVASDFEKPGDDDVIAKVKADLGAKGASVTEHDIRVELERLMGVARDQVLSEAKPDAPQRI